MLNLVSLFRLRVEKSDYDNGSDYDNDDDGGDANTGDEIQPYQMDVDGFRRCFGERRQLFRFW